MISRACSDTRQRKSTRWWRNRTPPQPQPPPPPRAITLLRTATAAAVRRPLPLNSKTTKDTSRECIVYVIDKVLILFMTLVIYYNESIVLSSAWVSKYVTRIYTLQNVLHLTTSSYVHPAGLPANNAAEILGVSLFFICRSDFTSPVCCGDKQDTSIPP